MVDSQNIQGLIKQQTLVNLSGPIRWGSLLFGFHKEKWKNSLQLSPNMTLRSKEDPHFLMQALVFIIWALSKKG
jgi:hypothetical protein